MIKEIWKKHNIVTFIGITFAILGIYFCYLGKISLSIVMLVLSGICDAIDGPIARKINGSNSNYGALLDSLSDIVAFGVLPVSICIEMGGTAIIYIIVYTLFVICGITRLAYYNVNSSGEEYFVGCPITCSAMVIPLIYLITKNQIVFIVALAILAISFVSNIKIKKPTIKMKILLSIIGIAILTYILLFKY